MPEYPFSAPGGNPLPEPELPLQMIAYFEFLPAMDPEILTGFMNDCDPAEDDLCRVEATPEPVENIEAGGGGVQRFHVRLGPSAMVVLLFDAAFPESLQPELINAEELTADLARHSAHALLHIEDDRGRSKQDLQVFMLKVATGLCRQGAFAVFNPWNGVVVSAQSLFDIASLDGSELGRLQDAIEATSVEDILSSAEDIFGEPTSPPSGDFSTNVPASSYAHADDIPGVSPASDDDNPGRPGASAADPADEPTDEFERRALEARLAEAAELAERIAAESGGIAAFMGEVDPGRSLTLWDLVRTHGMPTELLMTLAGVEDEAGRAWLVSRGMSVYGLPDLLYRVMESDTEREIALMKLLFEKVFRLMWREGALGAGDVFRGQADIEFRLDEPPEDFDSPFPTIGLLLVSRWRTRV